MMYQSTRSDATTATASMAILNGIAPDGGLYMLRELPKFPLPLSALPGMSTQELSCRILSLLLPDFSEEELKGIVSAAYTGKFETEDITPLVRVGDDYVLELFRGPTSAFKDVALSVLPHLITAARAKNGVTDKILILTATSGDTGKAALAGFCDVPGTGIIVFYPHGGVSAVQQAQMATQEGNNVSVCAIFGNFDDAQTGVKSIFSRVEREGLLSGKGVRLSSANSINIGRLAPQVVYYFAAYRDLIKMGRIQPGGKVNFIVPTGNFGDILAGYMAKLMGLPVNRLVCASNANDVLTDFINTGVYDRGREFYRTASPSMDILVSSNLERLLFLLSGCNAEEVADYMAQLREKGRYQVKPELLKKLQAEFTAACCNDAATFDTIGRVYKEFGYLMDTHTGVAWNALERFKAQDDGCPSVVLSTASPYKFCASVLGALGGKVSDDEFTTMEALHALTGAPVPAGLATLKDKPVLHKDVVEQADMLTYVLKKAAEQR